MSDPSTSSGPAVPFIPENHAISIPPPLNLSDPSKPCLELFQGNSRQKYIDVGIPLYEAALKGDWKAARTILDKQRELVRFAITENHETLLHIAASSKSTKAVEFVKDLVEFMKRGEFDVKSRTGDTALHSAAQAGNVEIAKILVKKSGGLIDIPNEKGLMPLYIAALFAHPEMVRYLYDISKNMAGDFWTHANRGWVLQKCVESEIFDIAKKIINNRPELIEKRWLLMDVLLALAKNTKAFEGEKTNFVFRIFTSMFRMNPGPSVEGSEAQQLLRTIWGKIAQLGKVEIDNILRGHLAEVKKENTEMESEVMPILRKILEKMDRGPKSEIEMGNEVRGAVRSYPSRLLFVAAKAGNKRFITEIISLYPDASWKVDDKGKTIFHLAIKRRQAEIYNLLYEIGAMKDLITPIRDNKGNNMLHIAAKSSKEKQFQNVSGAALHMQRELLWFQEVEKMIPLQYRERKNNAGETPQDLFAKKHASLITKGESWMKNYMLVATLIATIVFAAAFTLPGGYNQNTGIPYFRDEPSLIIFVISDAISLISSSTSVLIFLSILTSSYAELEFLESLPEKLMYGVATLFLSIVTMMIAFSASFFVLYTGKLKWVPITITCLAGMPIILFVKLQFHLLTNVFYSAYRSRSLFKPRKRILYG